jgi:hypothetical protein
MKSDYVLTKLQCSVSYAISLLHGAIIKWKRTNQPHITASSFLSISGAPFLTRFRIPEINFQKSSATTATSTDLFPNPPRARASIRAIPPAFAPICPPRSRAWISGYPLCRIRRGILAIWSCFIAPGPEEISVWEFCRCHKSWTALGSGLRQLRSCSLHWIGRERLVRLVGACDPRRCASTA